MIWQTIREVKSVWEMLDYTFKRRQAKEVARPSCMSRLAQRLVGLACSRRASLFDTVGTGEVCVSDH